MAAHDGRETRPDLGLGICGEHGGDPTSVEFCHNVGLDYVSCSPFRVPIARLAAAQVLSKIPEVRLLHEDALIAQNMEDKRMINLPGETEWFCRGGFVYRRAY